MLKRKENTVRNITAKWIYHLSGDYILFWGDEKHFLEINLILRVVSEQWNLYQAMIIRSVILPFKQIVTLDGWVVVLTPFMVLCNHLLTSHYLWL